MSTKNPVKAAFKLGTLSFILLTIQFHVYIVQQVWGKVVAVAACDSEDRPIHLRYKYLEIIGNGTFGIVCKAQNMDTNEIIAIKTVFQDEGHQVIKIDIILVLTFN